MMGSAGNPKSWAPFVNNKDCSQGFCSLYCQQWCYIIFPPSPSLDIPDDDHRRGSVPTFSPLVIAIIGILASALLLISYYSLISKYCGNTNSSSRRREDDYLEEELEENNIQSPNLHEPWVSSTGGLDEALIKSITTCKYKKGDGLIVEGSDCSVCLSEFNEDENIKLLPKCSHAFHVHCIDTWLKSHSNCPLCRANIIFVIPSLPPLLAAPTNSEIQQNNETTSEVNVSEASNIETNGEEEEENVGTSRVVSDNIEGTKDTVIQMMEESGFQGVRRSISMDHYPCHQTRVSIADILHMDTRDEDQCCNTFSEHNLGEISKYNRERRKVLRCVMDSVAMKRSFSSGRLSLTRQGRVCETIIPL